MKEKQKCPGGGGGLWRVRRAYKRRVDVGGAHFTLNQCAARTFRCDDGIASTAARAALGGGLRASPAAGPGGAFPGGRPLPPGGAHLGRHRARSVRLHGRQRVPARHRVRGRRDGIPRDTHQDRAAAGQATADGQARRALSGPAAAVHTEAPARRVRDVIDARRVPPQQCVRDGDGVTFEEFGLLYLGTTF